MTLSRILYTVLHGSVATKNKSAEWVKNKFGLPWNKLIKAAQGWRYGKKMSFKNETIDFTKFAIDQIKKTELYLQVYRDEE